jgi:hypothetical protein
VALIYDGRQLRRTTTHQAGADMLKPRAQSIFSGRALRCDTDSAMLAGFLKSEAVKPQLKPRHSSAWLAPAVPGGPSVPVRISFDAGFVGDIVVDLDAASVVKQAACALLPAAVTAHGNKSGGQSLAPKPPAR